MKRIIFSFILAAAATNINAQEDVVYNHPQYYQDGDCWMQALVPYDFEECIQEYETEGLDQDFSLYSFFVKGDTIIDNKEYKCVHAKTWTFDYQETDDHQPKGLIEGTQVTNVLFIREDADGKQWRRLAHLNEEALLFDFSHPFEEGQIVRFCKHCNLGELLDITFPKESRVKAHSAPNRPDCVEVWRSDVEAPQGYMYYDLLVSDITTIELPNGETVPCANGHIAFGLGDINIGDLWHQFVPDMESLDDRFLYRTHQNQVLLQNQDNINSINRIIGTDVLSLYKKTDNSVSFTQGQMATIIMPTTPDAGKGKYYRLDRCEEGQIIFEEELQPRAHVPYIIVPSEDFSIDPSTLDLEGLGSDTVSIDGIHFIGVYERKELPALTGGDGGESFYIDIIDTTPDCASGEAGTGAFHIGALRAFLQVTWDDPIDHGGSKVPEEKMLIVLKDNPDGIEGNEESRMKCEEFTAVYDLSGRQIVNSKSSNRKLQNGIYIENGKKKLSM